MGISGAHKDRARRFHLVLIFRITKKQYLTTLSGLGGSYEDGARWNKPGTPVLYFGTSAAVAMLEMAN